VDIRTYSPEYAREVADLYYAAVYAIDPAIYSETQKAAWAPEPIDYEYWSRRLEQKRPWLAFIDGHVAGFIELDTDGHIDCTYVHPDFQRRSVATALYRHLETEVLKRGIKRLYVEASLVAEPFFIRQGFQHVAENSVERRGVTLHNFTMEKWID